MGGLLLPPPSAALPTSTWIPEGTGPKNTTISINGQNCSGSLYLVDQSSFSNDFFDRFLSNQRSAIPLAKSKPWVLMQDGLTIRDWAWIDESVLAKHTWKAPNNRGSTAILREFVALTDDKETYLRAGPFGTIPSLGSIDNDHLTTNFAVSIPLLIAFPCDISYPMAPSPQITAPLTPPYPHITASYPPRPIHQSTAEAIKLVNSLSRLRGLNGSPSSPRLPSPRWVRTALPKDMVDFERAALRRDSELYDLRGNESVFPRMVWISLCCPPSNVTDGHWRSDLRPSFRQKVFVGWNDKGEKAAAAENEAEVVKAKELSCRMNEMRVTVDADENKENEEGSGSEIDGDSDGCKPQLHIAKRRRDSMMVVLTYNHPH